MSAAAARRYADAVFELAREQGLLDRVAQDLQALRERLADRELFARFSGVRATRREKQAMVDEKIAPGAHRIVANALKLMVQRNREASVSWFVLGFFERMQRERNVIEVEVESAREVSSAEAQHLAHRLSKATGKTVVVTAGTDPSLLGGMRMTVGSTRVDATIKRRLDELESRLRSAI